MDQLPNAVAYGGDNRPAADLPDADERDRHGRGGNVQVGREWEPCKTKKDNEQKGNQRGRSTPTGVESGSWGGPSGGPT